jgi:hypothetical protein
MRLWTAESGFESLPPSHTEPIPVPRGPPERAGIPPARFAFSGPERARRRIAVQIERHASLHLPIAPAAALPLFTPEGERDWVPGWDPVAIHAPGGSLSTAGAVFTTAADGEPTLWLVLGVDAGAVGPPPLGVVRGGAAGAGVAEYVRITPGNRLGTVRVRCTADGAGTRVEVDYRLTAISEAGAAKLAAVTPEAFAATIDGWRERLERLLAESGGAA